MRIILINGSPRHEGCTFTALSEVARILESEGIEAEIINASFDREAIRDAAARIIESDGVVIGSPVYYASASGLASYFMDEIFNIVSPKMRLKVGAAVVSCRRGGASATFDQLNKYFTISEMVVVGSSYWNQVHGNTPEEVRKDEEGMQTMRCLGRNIAYVVKSFNTAHLPLPEKEAKVKTNFIR